MSKTNDISVTSVRNDNILKLPVDVLGMIVEKSDTSSLYNLKKTSKLLNEVTNDYLDRNAILKMKTDVFTFELTFNLDSLTNEEYSNVLQSSIHVYKYHKIISVKICNSLKNKSIIFKIIYYNVNHVKEIFSKFLKDYNIYNTLMNIEDKYFKISTHITPEQNSDIYIYKLNNIRFSFDPVGNLEETKKLYKKAREDTTEHWCWYEDCTTKEEELKIYKDIFWGSMDLHIRSSSYDQKKVPINLNMDLTYC